MSTRAIIIVRDGEEELRFYRHSDGYPAGVKNTLGKFMKALKAGLIRDNIGQAAGWLVVLGHNEYLNSGSPGTSKEPAEGMYGWKCGAYEPVAHKENMGEEFTYIINIKTKKMTTINMSKSKAYIEKKMQTA